MAGLLLRAIRKSFGATQVLNDVSLEVGDREFLTLLGPSGCGKSTLLRVIAGLESADSGTVSIGGRPVDGVAPRDRDCAMVFQSYALYPHMDVYENMAFGLKRARYPKAEIEQRVQRAAKTLHIESLLTRRPRDQQPRRRQAPMASAARSPRSSTNRPTASAT